MQNSAPDKVKASYAEQISVKKKIVNIKEFSTVSHILHRIDFH